MSAFPVDVYRRYSVPLPLYHIVLDVLCGTGLDELS